MRHYKLADKDLFEVQKKLEAILGVALINPEDLPYNKRERTRTSNYLRANGYDLSSYPATIGTLTPGIVGQAEFHAHICLAASRHSTLAILKGEDNVAGNLFGYCENLLLAAEILLQGIPPKIKSADLTNIYAVRHTQVVNLLPEQTQRMLSFKKALKGRALKSMDYYPTIEKAEEMNTRFIRMVFCQLYLLRVILFLCDAAGTSNPIFRFDSCYNLYLWRLPMPVVYTSFNPHQLKVKRRNVLNSRTETVKFRTVKYQDKRVNWEKSEWDDKEPVLLFQDTIFSNATLIGQDSCTLTAKSAYNYNLNNSGELSLLKLNWN